MEKDKIYPIAIVGLLLIVGLLIFQGNNGNLGQSSARNTYSGDVTMGSTTVNVAPTTGTSILARKPARQWAVICNDGAGVVWIYESATGTSLVVDQGFPIASSTVYEHCYTIDPSHHYVGAVSGITNATTIIKYIEK